MATALVAVVVVNFHFAYFNASLSSITVTHSCDPEMYENDMLQRSLEGEITFRIFSLIVCSKEVGNKAT